MLLRMQRYRFPHYLCIVFRDKILEYNKESALYSLKSPNYQRGIYKAQRAVHILWVARPCLADAPAGDHGITDFCLPDVPYTESITDSGTE